MKQPSGDEPLAAVFFEGDGVPWYQGRTAAADPTTGNPLALDLLTRTALPAAYLTRPCYHALHDARCTPSHWTGARYSEEIVAGMAAAVREASERMRAQKILLIGYSGGGALAVLVAERLDNVGAVVTLAANLDVEAWAQHHRYLPLARSLNPARSDREHPWPEIHLSGARDVIVPPSTTAAYFVRFPAARQITLHAHDHVCCWVKQWPVLFEDIKNELEAAAGYKWE